MILDNADDLTLFGVAETGNRTKVNLHKYVPRTSQGTVLWTSRDAHITGTLVGPRRGIEVRSMTISEARRLLAIIRDEPSTSEEAGSNALLEELQCLPLAISQAGAYMRRTSMTIEEYLGLLRQGKTRWQILRLSDTDRHRRPEVSNSVLETWKISTQRIRVESEMSYRILHVAAYLDSQNIPDELLTAAASRYDIDHENSTEQVDELEVQEAVTRLKEFSFLSPHQRDSGGRSYDMHKLVQEAIRYGLTVRGSIEPTLDQVPGIESGHGNSETYYANTALRIVNSVFPIPEPKSWGLCEQYVTHAIRVGEWAEVGGAEIKTSHLLERVSVFLGQRGRCDENELVDIRAWCLRQEMLGEKHPDTIRSMASLAAVYHDQDRYTEAERLGIQALDLQREVLGERHPDTIRSMVSLAAVYHDQGRYHEAERLGIQTLDLQRDVLGERHPDAIWSIASLALTYKELGQMEEAERLGEQALNLQREVAGEKHLHTAWITASLADTYYVQGRYNEAEILNKIAFDLRRKILGDSHRDTIRSMTELAVTYYMQGRYNEAELLNKTALELRRKVLGESHPDTIRSTTELGVIYYMQGRYGEAEMVNKTALDFWRKLLGDSHPNTIQSMMGLAVTYYMQARYGEAEILIKTALDLRRDVLGESHPDTIKSMMWLAVTYYMQGRYGEAELLNKTALELRRKVLGESHPDTIRSTEWLALTRKSIT